MSLRRLRDKSSTHQPSRYLKEKNKELAVALEVTRKDIAKLKEQNLKLKRERQEEMEKCMLLESKLRAITTLYFSNIQSLRNVVSEIDANYSTAKSLFPSPEHTNNILSPISNCIHKSSTPIKTMVGKNKPALLEADEDMDISTPIKTMVGKNKPALLEADEDMDISDSIQTTSESLSVSNSEGLTSFLRPKRSCTFLVTSYDESSLLRNISFRKPDKIKQKKAKKFTDTPLRKGRSGLSDITNM